MAGPDDRNQEKADEIIREAAQLSSDRGVWEGHWQEVAERVLPAYSNTFNPSNLSTPGQKNTQLIYDPAATLALEKFSAICDSLLTPRSQTWHRLEPGDPALKKDRTTRLWFEEVNRLVFKYRYAPKANFSGQNQQNYQGLGAFGTGCMFIDELAGEPGLRYRAVHLGEIYFTENHQGAIDGALRNFPLKARQAAQKWGKENLPADIQQAVDKSPDKEFRFLHCVKPRADYDPQRRDSKGMRQASYYVSISGRMLLAESGYNTFPFAISRYTQAPGEIYGRSPAMAVLPAIKTLNEEKKTVLKQGQRTVDPVLLAHDDGVIDGFDMRAGALNAGAMTKDGKMLVAPLPIGNVLIGKELMDDERISIKDAFLVSLFQILVETPQMTATEVLERTREKGILLAPTFGRQQTEYLGPMIEREIDLLQRQRLLPPPPPALVEAGGEYKIIYDSPLSRAQRAEEAAGLARVMEMLGNYVAVTQDPSPYDHLDMDEIVPALADIQAVPTKWLASAEAVAAKRQGRQQQAQLEQAAAIAPGAAAMVKAGAVASKPAA